MIELKITITGATGMVGYHLVKHLLERGNRVTALARKTSNLDKLQQLALKFPLLDIVTAELSDRAGLVQCLRGAQVVVHAAGSVDPLARRQDIFNTNVNGTATLLSAAIEAAVQQFVHISSLSVITGQGDQFQVNETAELKYCGEAYADSKVDAEKLVMQESAGKRIQVTVLRPGFIYGPGERAWMPRLIGNLSSGKAMLIDGGTKETNVVYIGNLCRAAEASIMNPKAFGQVFNLTDGQKISKKLLFDTMCDALGFPRIKRSVPGPLARLVCEVVSSVAPYLPESRRSQLSRFSRAAFRLAGVNQGFDISKAERLIGYTDRISFSGAMTETLKTFSLAPGGTAGPKPAAEKGEHRLVEHL